MKEPFNPIRGKRGEFRIALNVTELADRAWEMLSLSQTLGFEPPQFQSHVWHSGVAEVWAVLLQQFHGYDANTNAVVDPWDDAIDALRQAIGKEQEFSLMVLCNFAEYLEPVDAIA